MIYVCIFAKIKCLRKMKNYLILAFAMLATTVFAQNSDTKFKGEISNDKYNVYIKMNFYENNIVVPGQDVLGELPGFFAYRKDARTWLFTDAEIVDENTVQLDIINDYGSEDLKATLTYNPDGTYTLRQLGGSTIKIAVNRKWVKIPKTLVLHR